MQEMLSQGAKLLLGLVDSSSYTTTTTGGRTIDPLNRKPPDRKFYMPVNYYDPIFGVPGITERPSTVSGRVSLPVEMREHPSRVLFGGNNSHKSKDSWINDPKFWDHYRALKERHFDWNYDPNMQLGVEHYAHRASVRIRDNSNGATTYNVTNHRTPEMLNGDNFYRGYGNSTGFHQQSVF